MPVRLPGLKDLAKDVKQLKDKVRELGRPRSVIVPVITLEPEPFELLKEIKVVVEPSGDEYIASFFDANVNAGGCTETEAVENLKDVLVGLFDYLASQPPKRLGPGPAKQLAVLKTFLRKRK